MVHQLSLVSSIPHSSYIQTVSTLQALTGLSSPQKISTYTLLTRPHDVFKPKFEPGKVNQIEQYHMRCTTTWSEQIDISKPILRDSDEILADILFVGHDNRKQWTLQIADIPNAGKNQPCCAQTVYESTLVHHHTKVMELGDQSAAPEAPKEPEDIKKEDPPGVTVDAMEIVNDDPIEIKEETMEVIDHPIVVLDEPEVKEEPIDMKVESVDEVPAKEEPAEEVMKEPVAAPKKEPLSKRKDSFLQFIEDLGYDVVNQYWISGIRFFHGDVIIEIYKILIRDDSPSANEDKIKLKLLDESNTFQIKTYINCPKATDVEFVNQGTKDLLRLQEFFKNLFVLEVPDRMFMDSRINRQS